MSPPRAALALCLSTLLALFPGGVKAESLEELFRAGNKAFAQGDYGGAVQRYQSLVDAGIRDADVYMNLGLAHARRGELGRAVLAFEQSLHVRPGDDDATNALGLARAAVGKRRAERHGEALVETRPPLAEALVRPYTEQALAVLLLISDAAFFICLILRRRARTDQSRTGLAVAATLLGLVALCLLSGLVIKRGALQEGRAAIVLRDAAELREAPDPRASVRARAPEGGSARVLARDQGFARVRTASGAEGFMSDGDVGLIAD